MSECRGDADTDYRLTQYAHGGGCACKIPPGELEAVVAGLVGESAPDGPGELIVGLDDGDDAAVVRIAAGTAVVATADFFTPVVDDAYDWGRIAAANALSDVYAMGGTPVVAVNLLGWPRDVLPMELAAEVLRGGLDRGAGGRLSRGRRAQRGRPGTQVRHGGHRDRRPGPADAQRRRGGGRAADPDQAAGHRRAEQPAQDHR